VHLGVEADAASIAAEDPDVVVVATGADPLVPPIAGADGPGVVDALELLYERVRVEPGQHVAIVGGSATGCETAELLLERGAAVTILEMAASIGHGIEAITRRWLVRELRRRGATVLTRATVTAIDAGRVRYETADGPGDVPADVVALAVGWRPRGAALATALAGREVVVVGDAEQPGDFVAATGAGARAALYL